MIRLGRANVRFSIPLTTLSTGTPAGTSAAMAVERRSEVRRGDRHHDQVGPADGQSHDGSHLDIPRQQDVGQMAAVLAGALQFIRAFGVARPDRDGARGPGEQHAQRCSHPSRAEDRDLLQHVVRRRSRVV